MSTQFQDYIKIKIKPGNGGRGSVSFYTEKFVEKGGPDGGNGGKGGNIYFKVNANLLSLSHFRMDITYKAGNGFDGQSRKCSGKDGQHVYLNIPMGTQLIDVENKSILYEFIKADEVYLLGKGGRGGKGNAHFKNSIRQSPDFAQPGEIAQEKPYILSLKMIADIGLIGFPNSGKSSLLKVLTAANPQIAPYPFTTLAPNLGILLNENYEKMIIADIPGILEGAHKGHGLGLSFLKHIERVKCIIFVLDITISNIEDEFAILKNELHTYNKNLLEKPFLIVINKIDQIEDKLFLKSWLDSFQGQVKKILPISAHTQEGILELKKYISKYFKI